MGLESRIGQNFQAFPETGNRLGDFTLLLGCLSSVPQLFCRLDLFVFFLTGGQSLLDQLPVVGDPLVGRLERFRLVGRCEGFFQLIGGRNGLAFGRFLHERQEFFELPRLCLRLPLQRVKPGRFRVLRAPEVLGGGKPASQIRQGSVVIVIPQLCLARREEFARTLFFRLLIAGRPFETGKFGVLFGVELCGFADLACQDKGLLEIPCLHCFRDLCQFCAGLPLRFFPLGRELLFRSQHGRVLRDSFLSAV